MKMMTRSEKKRGETETEEYLKLYPRGIGKHWDTTDASNFWDAMDTSELTRDEIALLSSYLLAYYRSFGYDRVVDKFLSETKIEESEELQGQLGNYKAEEECYGPAIWHFFCRDMLKLKRQKEVTFKTTSNKRHVDKDDGKFSIPRRVAFSKIAKFIGDYVNKNLTSADFKYRHSNVEINDQGQEFFRRILMPKSSGSKKRKSSNQIVNV